MKQGVELVSEPVGFKLMLAGTASWIGSMAANLDLAQVAGFIVAVVGVVMQIAAYRRNQAADKRERDADRREREKHKMAMALLKKKLGSDAPSPDFTESET